MKLLAAVSCLALAMPFAASAQETAVTRRAYTFLDDRLVVSVHGGTPGQLRIVRGEAGRVEVAARSLDGFAGFGLGGTITPELRLTAVGSEQVGYLVVVPEQVRIVVHLPDGARATVPGRAPIASYSWGADDASGRAPDDPAAQLPLMPTLPNGLFLIHASRWAPPLVDVPSLDAVRTLSVRFEGSEFRVAASRPLSLSAGEASRLELRLAGEPVDVVVYVPYGAASFHVRSGAQRLVDVVSGRPRALCGNVVVQSPTPQQHWLTFHPQAGRLDCR
jgi:hypothetical protein